ncbi:MAG: cohesin domain-containing protein [Luteolibacter sp.]
MCLQAAEYTLSMPHFLGRPGEVVEVPISIDNGSGYARVRIQINYDPQVAQLISVTSGPVGDQFEMLTTTEDGWVTLDFLRTEDLAGQPGDLARLKFRLNGGSTTDLYSDLSIAKFEIGDSSGVVALSLENDLSTQNGSITVSLNSHIDNGSNGLPDWWEDLHGLDKFSMLTANSDADGDGATAILEYGLNGNPNQADARSLFGIARKSENPSVMQLSLQLRNDDPSLVYQLGTSSNLTNWTRYPITWNGTAWSIDNNPLGISIGSSVSEGNGIWTLKLEQSSEGSGKQFFRTEVDR